MAALIILLIAGGSIGVMVKLQNDQVDAKAEKVAAQEAADAQAAAEQAEHDRQAAADARERDDRSASVTEIESSVKTMAEDHVKEGIVDGPVIQVSCDPVNGGSTDDLTQKTTVFQCFVANKDNEDGTMSGYYYNATMNWDSGSYTYGMGQP